MINHKSILVSLFILQPWFLNGLIRLDLVSAFLCFTICIIKNDIKFPIKEFIFISISLFIVISITTAHLEFDISLLKKYITISILIISGYYITTALNIEIKDLVNSISLLVIFCFIFYLLSIQFDFFRQLSLLLKGETYGIENKLEVYRLWFPTSAHTFHLGLLFVVSLTILLCEKKSFFLILICIICAGIAARSALIFSLILCSMYILLKDKKYLFIFVLLLPIGYILIENLSNQYIEVKYALEPIENLISSGTIQSKSSDALLEKHLFIPNFSTLIFGDGIYTNADDSFYQHTDSGIIRPILYGGIFFQIFYFIFTYRYLSSLKRYGIYGFITLLILYVANIKAEILSTTPYLSLLVILYYINKKEVINGKSN